MKAQHKFGKDFSKYKFVVMIKNEHKQQFKGKNKVFYNFDDINGKPYEYVEKKIFNKRLIPSNLLPYANCIMVFKNNLFLKKIIL